MGHVGSSKMKSLARMYVWRPKLDQELENLTQRCPICQENKASPPKVPLHPWGWPEDPWMRIHADFAGPIDGEMFLLILDAYSKWPEIIHMKRITSDRTVRIFRDFQVRHGIPVRLVTDNGTQFTAEEFQVYIRENGIRHCNKVFVTIL